MTDRYQAAIRDLIDAGDVDYVDENNNVRIAAEVIFDAFMFAATPSVSTVISAFLGYYAAELTPPTFPTDADLGAAILETIRVDAPVIGVPYVKVETNIRQSPLAGMSGYDESVFGLDAREFRVRLTDEEYQEKSLNWANAAVGIPGKPGTSHVCPAKSLSFNMMLAFLKAMDPTSWTSTTAKPISRTTTRPSNGSKDVVWTRKNKM